MKNDFILAFNQICTERNLSQEIVLEALTSALVSAYRRNVNASSAQTVTAEIDTESGESRIYAEKEVVESVQDERTEVTLENARAVVAEAQLNDMVMVDATPKHFGRIAAQTAKQVILQRIREAERDAQYAIYSEREGEIINGTVQSISGHGVTLNLGRTEALLPKNQQVPRERYQLHQRIRAYVLEVRKTNRGPQIIVSRNHKSMLRRLLELEVPEIYNGTVEIKSIARESGARSKVAVAATQAGVDPVGSCVGMRGVRIQSIVSELSGEKIDVIEWSADTALFIAKALSPARVLTVHPDDDPNEGKTALVVVPDDQLSLAIGREGQNARLAAKLTGWRIDINGATEATQDTIIKTQEDPTILEEMDNDSRASIPTLQAVLQRHEEQSLPWNADELAVARQVIDSAQSILHKRREAERVDVRAQQEKESVAKVAASDAAQTVESAREAEALDYRARVPRQAYETTVSELGLSGRVMKNLDRAGFVHVGQIHERMEKGEEAMLAVDGIGPKALAEIKRVVEEKGLGLIPLPEPVEVEEEAPVVEEAEAAAEQVDEVAQEVVEDIVEPVEQVEVPVEAETEVTDGKYVDEAEVTFDFEEGEIEMEEPGTKKVKGKPKKKKGKRKDRTLLFDEELGEVVAVKGRKERDSPDLWDQDAWEEK